RDGAFEHAGRDPDRPLIILAQEAYRSDDTIPSDGHPTHHGGALHPPDPDDIIEVARAWGLSLRYAPSMRNGLHRSDRGNAILSTVALGSAHAFLLPYVWQRRVAVTAEIAGLPDFALASVHLDVGGQPERRRFGRYGGGRTAQAEALVRRLAPPGQTHR